jgi:hypothetical protein
MTSETTPSRRAGLRDAIAAALEDADYRRDMRRGDLADAVLPVLYQEWPWLRAEAEDAAPTTNTTDAVEVLEKRLRLAHQARRTKEGQLDGIRRALCDLEFIGDDDPYGHADLEDVIRQVGEADRKQLASLRAEVAAARKFAAEMREFCSPHGVATDYADRLVEVMDRANAERLARGEAY